MEISSMSRQERLLVSLGAGILGLLLNLFPVFVFSGVTFHFGGALSLYAGLLFGPALGLLTAIITNLPLLSTGNHQPDVLLSIAETMVVAWTFRRHSIQPLIADFVFRSCAVLPWSV